MFAKTNCAECSTGGGHSNQWFIFVSDAETDGPVSSDCFQDSQCAGGKTCAGGACIEATTPTSATLLEEAGNLTIREEIRYTVTAPAEATKLVVAMSTADEAAVFRDGGFFCAAG